MKQRLSLIALAILLLSISGCARSCTSFSRSFEFGPRHYQITQYSGGEVVGRFAFTGILNDADGSDGYYWFSGDTLIEVSGDLTIKSWE